MSTESRRGQDREFATLFKIAEPDRGINPRDCVSEPFLCVCCFVLLSDVYSHFHFPAQLPTVIILAYRGYKRK